MNDRTRRCPIPCIAKGTHFKHLPPKRAKDQNQDKRIPTILRAKIRCHRGPLIGASLSKSGPEATLNNSTISVHNTLVSRNRKTEILADTYLKTQIL